MDIARLLAEFARHQEDVLAHLAGTRALLARSPGDVMPDLARRRWELVRMLRGYQLFKHGELFDPLIRRGGPAAPMAAAMKARCIALGEAFAAHTRLWASGEAAGMWPDYVGAELAMTDRLRDHLLRERREAGLLTAPATRVA